MASRRISGSGARGVVEGLAAAASHCRSRIALVGLPPETDFSNRLRLPRRTWERTRAVLQHARLPRAVGSHLGSDLVVVPEFLTLPFLFAAPRLLARRRRLLLMVTHNLQQAARHRLHRSVLRALMRSGFGFCCLESDAGVDQVLSPGPGETPLLLPHVIREDVGRRPEAPEGARPCLGVVGVSRPEKGDEALLEHLVALRDQGGLEAKLLLGCPEPQLASRWVDRVDHTADTRDPDEYEAALARCDVVAFNYSEPHYRFRGSGVVTDAVAQGCSVVCPDLPVLRAQVTQPRPVGGLFRSLDELLPAIRRGLAARREDPTAFEAYRQARSPRTVAERLDRYARTRLATAPPG